jgi:hypothetical protein
MLRAYKKKRFTAEQLKMIEFCNSVLTRYQAKGMMMTLRQLYYQAVAKDKLPENTMKEYKKFGDLVSDGRMAGLISWRAIEDRTRNLKKNWHSTGPKDAIETISGWFGIDKWENQETRVEVWIEKDALLGVIGNICETLDVPYFSCRGYTSQTELWIAGQRVKRYVNSAEQNVVVLHLGDHDPSGIDMTRDIQERVSLFADGVDFQVKRLALNMDQVEKYNPPPNPAKIGDPRAKDYIKTHGEESWELDALEPEVLQKLIEKNVLKYRDERKWAEAIERQEFLRKAIVNIADDQPDDSELA